MAVVEAKRKNVDVSGSLQQAKRYSRTFTASAETQLHERNWGTQSEHRIPFVFLLMVARICGSWQRKVAYGFVTCAILKTVVRRLMVGTAQTD